MEVGSGVLRGLGQSLISMAVSIIGSCLIRIVWIYTVFAMDRQLVTLYWSYPASWLLTFLVHLATYLFIRHMEAQGKAHRIKIH